MEAPRLRREHYKLELDDGKLTPEELAAKHGRPVEEPEEEAAEESTSSDASEPTPTPKRKRLDG